MTIDAKRIDAERLDAQGIDAKRIDAQMQRENTVEKSRVLFSSQAQYLVKLECDFSWQAQHVVTF